MIEILSAVPTEVVILIAGILIGHGCPKCAKAIIKKLGDDAECDECPDGDCFFCPEDNE